MSLTQSEVLQCGQIQAGIGVFRVKCGMCCFNVCLIRVGRQSCLAAVDAFAARLHIASRTAASHRGIERGLALMLPRAHKDKREIPKEIPGLSEGVK